MQSHKLKHRCANFSKVFRFCCVLHCCCSVLQCVAVLRQFFEICVSHWDCINLSKVNFQAKNASIPRKNLKLRQFFQKQCLDTNCANFSKIFIHAQIVSNSWKIIHWKQLSQFLETHMKLRWFLECADFSKVLRCCHVLQCVAVCGSVWQCVAVCSETENFRCRTTGARLEQTRVRWYTTDLQKTYLGNTVQQTK